MSAALDQLLHLLVSNTVSDGTSPLDLEQYGAALTGAVLGDESPLCHVRGLDNLKAYSQSYIIASGKLMTNHFCSTYGTLMYRTGERFPGRSVLRIGTVDDFHLHETKLKPKREIFVKDRVGWLFPVDGAEQVEG